MSMSQSRNRLRRKATGIVASVLVMLAGAVIAPLAAHAGLPWGFWKHHHHREVIVAREPSAGEWYWLRSPDQERRVMIDLFNRYCIRCHGVDGRGVWDIPDVPNFSNPLWQATRTDAELSRTILEGRGACMPPFRGTLSLEEACAMAHYVRTFVPGTGLPRPVIESRRTTPAAPARPAQTPRAATIPPLPEPLSPAPFAR